jgi:3'-phosphoadenosine 5'-phosphosulfate sulfotransferase (PAPS reductase)/FAD synthetase
MGRRVRTAQGEPAARLVGNEIWDYIRKKRLPYNSLHDSGFPSIGCAPCTRAVQPAKTNARAAGGGNAATRASADCTRAARWRFSQVNYFPVFFDLTGQKVLVVGGGEVALRKVALLERTGAIDHAGRARKSRPNSCNAPPPAGCLSSPSASSFPRIWTARAWSSSRRRAARVNRWIAN